MESKQRRRYSCQSWNVAAKVVIKPETEQDDITETNIDDFVTALQDCQDDSEDENLETCYEDLSDATTETLCCESDQQSRILPKTGEEIINMCDLVQERLRKSLLLDNPPYVLSSQQDIEAVNKMIHQTEPFLTKSKSPEESESQTIQVPNWNENPLPLLSESEYSRTIMNSDKPSSQTFVVRETNCSDISSSETLCINETMSETLLKQNNDEETSSQTELSESNSNSTTTTHQNETANTNCDVSLTQHIS